MDRGSNPLLATLWVGWTLVSPSDCKSLVYDCGGSIPSRPTYRLVMELVDMRHSECRVRKGVLVRIQSRRLYICMNFRDWLIEEGKKSSKPNPWAICTSSVGRKDKAKYERCVLSIKDKHGIAH